MPKSPPLRPPAGPLLKKAVLKSETSLASNPFIGARYFVTYNDQDGVTGHNNRVTGIILSVGWDTYTHTLSLKVHLCAPGYAIIQWGEKSGAWTLEIFSEDAPYGPCSCNFYLLA